MRRFPGNHHLVKHLALIDFLFDSFEQFNACYSSVASSAASGQLDNRLMELHSTREQIFHLVQVDGQSINKAAAQVGVQTAQAVKWVKRVGISYQTRARVLDRGRKAKLLRMLRAGKSRDEIEESLSIKKSWLRAFLASQPAIRAQWLEKLTAARRDKYRKGFVELMRANTGVPMRRIKAIPGNGFSWLYNHDRDWLVSQLPVLPNSDC
jgi:transposase